MSQRVIRWIAVLAAVPMLALSLAAASAAAAEPTGEYAVFNQCPLSAPDINSCVYSDTTSGEVVIGSTSTPIANPIIFQGGESREVVITEREIERRGKKEIIYEEEAIRKFVPAANGETLVKTPEPVPGGLLGLLKCEEQTNPLIKALCKLAFENALTGANATTELVGEANFSFAKLASGEVGLVMPVRIHLENPLLGDSCYIGSASEPISLNLTTGTTSPPAPNEPITGSSGEVEIFNNGKLVVASKDSAVDNSFSVPAAQGCGGPLLELAVDQVVDSKLGLPSAAGNNTAILDGTLEQASAGAVEESE